MNSLAFFVQEPSGTVGDGKTFTMPSPAAEAILPPSEGSGKIFSTSYLFLKPNSILRGILNKRQSSRNITLQYK